MPAPPRAFRFAAAPATLLLLAAWLLLTGSAPAAQPAAGSPPPPGAVGMLAERVTAGTTTERGCLSLLGADAPGVVQRTLVAPPAGGLVYARLAAAKGDWDVAVFDKPTGHRIAGSSGFRANELAEGFVGAKGRAVVVQACRRPGAAKAAQLGVHALELPDDQLSKEKASLIEVSTPTRADKARLQDLGLDLTEHGGTDHLTVVAYGDRDLGKLRAAGFAFEVEVPDLLAQDRLDRQADREFALATNRSALPSGRDAYRRLAEIEAELKALAAKAPNLVKPITLKNKSLQGRDVNGIEVSKDVGAADGKPVFLQMGVHHAREWPSVEMPMEFANELVNGFGKDQRITDLLSRARVIFVPVVNVDGYNLSREAPVELTPVTGPIDQNVAASCDLGEASPLGVCLGYGAALVADPGFAYKRRNCRVSDTQAEASQLCGVQAFRMLGVDPNRNYGGFWGGPGASTAVNNDTYRGPAPFSEPESQNIRELVSSRQVTTLITNHTFSNLLLRPPGLQAQGPPPDETIYKALGDAMAGSNGYASQKSFELYDTTGTTEDWTYYATGGLGFTYEIGPDQFHPPYAEVIDEYLGKAGTPTAGKGNREAYLTALESTVDTSRHSVVKGKGVEGATLRLKKSFVTETFPQADGKPIAFEDTLDTTMVVGKGDAFSWHANPSRRPGGNTPGFEKIAEQPSSEAGIESQKQTTPGGGFAKGDANVEDVPITITAGEATKLLRITVDASPVDDYDLEFFAKGGEEPIATSGGSAGAQEVIDFRAAPGEYVLRVVNFAAVEPWTGKVSRFGPGPVQVNPKFAESWTLTCETADGRVLQSQKVDVDRGETEDAGNVCGPNAREIIANAEAEGKAGAGSGTAKPDALGFVRDGAGNRVCATTAGFKTARVRPSGRTATFDIARRVAQPVTVEVFQASLGSKVVGNRLVARFKGLTGALKWNGRGRDGRTVRDGHLFVRFSMKGLGGRTDVRRETLVRRGGRFSTKPTFYRRANCDVIGSFKLTRPVFGGSANRSLGISYRLASRGDVTLTINRGARQVRRVTSRGVKAQRLIRSTLRARGLAKGDYTVRLSVRSGGRTVRSALLTRKL